MRKRFFEVTKNYQTYKIWFDNKEGQYTVETSRNTFYNFVCEYSVLQFIDSDSDVTIKKENELRKILTSGLYSFKEYIK